MVHSKWCDAYDGEHGIFNEVFSDKYHSTISAVWSPNKEWFALNEKTMGLTEPDRIMTRVYTI
jgi:hypothetical protein